MRVRVKKVLAACCLMCVLAGCSNSAEAEGYTQVDAETAAQMMADKDDEIVLDVRSPEEYQEQHIPEAINIPNETIGEEPIDALPDKEQLILVYCRSGNRSKQAAEKLAAQGYTNIVEFGGINDWQGETVAS